MKTPARVAHLVPALFGPSGTVGGAERYVFELARHMADHADTTLVTFGPAPSETLEGRLRLSVVGPARFVRGQRSNPFAWAAIREALKADVVHCHQQHILSSSLAAIAARVTGRRVFCTDLGGGGWDLSTYVSTDRLYHGHLHISAYSRHVFGHDHWPRARVIYGGVDAQKFSPGTDNGRPIDCLFVGRLLPHKGVDFLLEAATPDLNVVLAGPAPNRHYLADLHELAIGKRVRFVHDADDEQIVALYRQASCIALPSVYRDRYGRTSRVPELLGQTLLEGMACGAAGLCTSVASLPELVEDGVTGSVVRPNDAAALRGALVAMRAEPEMRRAMGEAGRARVLQRFTWARVVESCMQAYAA